MEERMKYLKMLGLAAISAAALTALFGAGSASATTLTGTGCTGTPSNHCAVGTTITSEAEGMTILHPPFGTIECEASTVSGKTTTTGGASETVKGNIETLDFSKCNATVTTLANGSLEVHSAGNSNGTLTSTGSEVTVEYFGTHCIFKTSNTDIGLLTGSTTTKTEHATFDISATIPRTGGRSGAFCGSTAQWTGSYKVTSPTKLIVD
jgi:hypothetical protein